MTNKVFGGSSPHHVVYLIEQVPGLIVFFGAAPAEDRFVIHLHQLPFRAEAEVAKNSVFRGGMEKASKESLIVTSAQRPGGWRTELQPELCWFFQSKFFEGH